MKTVVFDIETSALGMGPGMLLSFGFAVLPGSATVAVKTVADFRDFRKNGDESLVRWALSVLMEPDAVLVGHNIAKFDLPFLISRGIQIGLSMQGWSPLYYDTLKGFRSCPMLTLPNGFGKKQAGLEAACDAFDIDANKTHIMVGEWWQAIFGLMRDGDVSRRVMQTMRSIKEHNRNDVLATSELFRKLLVYDAKLTIRRFR